MITFNAAWPTASPFEQTGGAMPWSNPMLNNNAFHDVSNNLSWVVWERGFTSGDKRVVTAITRDTSNNWSTTDYLVGANTLKDDAHGAPAVVVDGSGYGYVFYGSHNSSVQIASTASANDPSVWYDQPALSGTFTFPQPCKVGSNIYLVVCVPSPSNAPTLQGAVKIYKFSSSAGVLTTVSSKVIADGYDGTPGWLPNSDLRVNGTDIHITAAWAGNDGYNKKASYYLIYDTATGNVRNFSGSTVVVPASQPISKATLDTSFKIQSPAAGGFPSLAIDGNGASHVIVYDGVVPSGQIALGTNAKMYYMTGTAGGSLSSPLLLYTFPANIDPSNCSAGIVLNSSGGIDVYFPDGMSSGYSFPLSGGSLAGNILSLSRSSSGVWTTVPRRIIGMTTNGIDYPVPVINGPSSFRMLCTEVATDYTALQGGLKGWAFDDAASNVVRATVADATQTTAFLARTTGLNAAHTAAYKELINGLVADGIFSLLDCLYILGTQSTTNAALNLISTSFPLTVNGSPTFTADKGYQGTDGSSIWLDSGYNMSTANLNYTQNDCSMFVWPITTGSPYNGDYIGSWASGQLATFVDYFSDSQIGARINATSGSVTATVTSTTGFIAASLTGGTMKLFKDGTQAGSGAWTATGLRNDTIKLIGAGAGDGCGAQQLAGGWGKSMTNNQIRKLWQRIYVWGATVGAITS